MFVRRALTITAHRSSLWRQEIFPILPTNNNAPRRPETSPTLALITDTRITTIHTTTTPTFTHTTGLHHRILTMKVHHNNLHVTCHRA